MFAQQEVGFIEKFATASDRRTALQELIPGTEDFYLYHCLHYQNEKQLSEAQAVIDQWRAKFGENANVTRMLARQMILTYEGAPQATIDYLRNRLQVSLEHAPPRRDRAATLPSVIAPDLLLTESILKRYGSVDTGFVRLSPNVLPKLVDSNLAPAALRAWLQRLERADFAGLVEQVAKELKLPDSLGFGWAPVHQLLTLKQLEQLLKLRPELLGHDQFIRAYLARLAPPDDVDPQDRVAQREYLDRTLKFVRTLPASQNSLKAMVLGNLLRLNLREGKFDRPLLLEYLALPRQAHYYNVERFQNQAVTLADLNFALAPVVVLPPIGDDTSLIRSYLEHFFQSDSKLDDLARFINRDYLERVLAETKILYGAADAATWYAKLDPAAQKALRERVEVRFAPGNPVQYSTADEVVLAVDLKNVSKLLVKVYEVNPRNYFRAFNRPLSTDIELDGLVANAQRQLEFSQPADRRHGEKIDLPECVGRGVWVVDLLGAGQRCRTLIQKGSLSSVQTHSDLGHVLQVFDELGQLVKTAHAEIGDRAFEPDSQGRILIPYVESAKSQNVLLVDGNFAAQELMLLKNESYQLQVGFIIDRQALVAGTQASLLVRAGLSCNGRPTSLKLLEKPQLTIVATDLDGLPSTQTILDLELSDSGELLHKFLVPQRLAQIEFKLSGRVYNHSSDQRVDVSASELVTCNGNLRTTLVGSFYLQPNDKGYRLLVLGRNGEPIPKLPVQISFQSRDVNEAIPAQLATDAAGEINLGSLPRVVSMTAQAEGVQGRSFVIDQSLRAWPTTLHQSTKDVLVLPLGSSTMDADDLSLLEVLRGTIVRDWRESLQVSAGTLKVAALPSGNYQLRDYRTGSVTTLVVVENLSDTASHLITATRALEVARRQPLVIQQSSVTDKEIRIQLAGADKFTRVHILAHPFEADLSPARQALFPFPELGQQSRRRNSSFYIDSLQLDEEYSYILQRQQATRYPGNMLAQPSLLIHPWEISLSDNQSKQAQAGDAIPMASDPAAAPAPMQMDSLMRSGSSASQTDSYDFLSHGTLVAGNLRANEQGEVVVPREALAGYTNLIVLAVHPTTLDARNIRLPHSPIEKRDLRLKSAFAAESHLAETQSVRALKAGEKTAVGDARTTRLQVFATLGDVYRLYGTLLKSSDLEKFRFVTQWPELSDAEKQARYSEMSCHELDYFLYRKDRPFFDKVVAPFMAQKMDKQFVDLWMLDQPIEAYRALWRTQRLNTLERILLAQKIKEASSGTQRWLDEFLAANPIDLVSRSQRFEIALRGSLLDGVALPELEMLGEAVENFSMSQNSAFGFAAPRDMAGGMPGQPEAAKKLGRRSGANRLERSLSEKESKQSDKAKDGLFFDADRLADGPVKLEVNADRFFKSLAQTRQWAETQYYQVRLENQKPELVPPSSFWQEFLKSEQPGPFLSQNIDLPVSNVNEALLALAVLDLPWTSEPTEMNVENDRLVITTKQPAIAYVQSIEPAESAAENPAILVGQDIYLAEPHTDQESNRPLQSQPLLIGVPYRTSVVVTNPTSKPQRVQVLCQLPAGAMPLAASRVTRSTPVELQAYSTAQVQYTFYFPASGQFAHYGSQVSSDGKHITHTSSETLRVLAEPENVDETTWSYIADWGTNDAVLGYLAKANLQKLDLSRIAFRLQDKAFYDQLLALLSASGRYDQVLWAYSLKHSDANNIRQWLHNRPDFTGLLGPVIVSSLITVDPREQMSYEHLDYRPLVVARMHQLGSKRLILNDKLYVQYQRLLDVMAYQSQISDDQRMELCYYLLIQNRIEEAIDWFDQVKVDQLATRLLYDYFAAYLNFFRGKYELSAQIAERYAAYPVPRWRELFGEISDQVRQRDALLSGQAITSVTSLDSGLERDDRLLTDKREAQQNRLAAESPALELNVVDGSVSINHRNLDEVVVNYYLMDIELLFSRNPFAAQGGGSVPAIRPNVTERLKLPGGPGASQKLELPVDVRNRNVLVEVSAKGISRVGLLTASTLSVNVTESYGRLQVLSGTDRHPVEAAYVKVYARRSDGSVRFFKDGYTDLRGQFDYASLSTSDLDSTERLSILVLDAKHGALVREAAPPTR